MKKLGQKTFNVIVSSLMMLALLPTNLTTISAENTKVPASPSITVDGVLDDAAYYGITAGTSITLSSHMDSNFATKEYNYGGNITLGKYTNAQNAGSVVVGKIDQSMTLTATTPVNIRCTEEDADKIVGDGSKAIITTDTQTNINSYIDKLLKHVTDQSNTMAGLNSMTYGSSTQLPTLTDQNNYVIDLTSYDDGTFYIGNSDELWKNISSGGVKIKKRDGQTIVFNFTDTSVTLNQFFVDEVSDNGSVVRHDSATSDQTNEIVAKAVIFNMPNATTFGMTAGVAGMFLAPKASVYIGHTSTGWLVCNTVTGNSGEWHNVYQKEKQTVQPGDVTLSATKTVDGQPATNNQVFKFDINEYTDGTFIKLRTLSNELTKEGFVTSNSVTNTAASISIDFKNLNFVQFGTEGTRWFTLTEEQSAGYKVNTTTYYIVVKTKLVPGTMLSTYEVTANVYTSKDLKNEYTDVMTFENETNGYVTPTHTSLSVMKTLTGRADNAWLGTDSFSFTLAAAKAGTPMPVKGGETVTVDSNSKNHTESFGTISYDKAGTYEYTITEDVPSNTKGITYDGTAHKATVTVVDNGEGGLKIDSVKYDDANTVLTIVNNYNASGEFTLSATKAINGRDWNDDDSFTFNVVAEEGSPAVKNSSATATKASPVAYFGKISFTQAGTYKYDITEEIPDGATKTADGQYALKGVVYDSATHVVTITVVDNGDGTLTATSDAGTSLKVTNSYTDIKFNKYDSNNNQLSGAKLALYEAGSATALDTWTSSADAESLGDYLVRGHNYVIRELSAPAGYATFDDVKFTLNADGSVTGLESLTKDADGAYKLIDAVLDVRVQKVTTKGDKLTGAVLALLDANGKVVDQWTTDGTDHVVKGLVDGAKYSIHEVSAPRGYAVASDISFTVENNGKTQSFTMVDDVIETPYTPTTPTPDRPTTPTAPDRPTTPNTGDQTNLPMAVACMLFGTMAAMFVVFFKRKYSD
jgi:pilin isopeptide linkage protein